MTNKTLGYMELEWTCPNCNTNNPGMQKTCKSCGSPQPENVQFHAPVQQTTLTDEKKIAQAQKGADFHCPYCNTRNPADAKVCSQCGGDLTGAAQRISGTVIGATATQATGAAVTTGAPPKLEKTPSKFRIWMLIPVAAILMVCCVIVGYLVFHTDAITGNVQSVSWQRTVPIEALRDVNLEDWKDQLPQDARSVSCDLKYRGQQDSPAAYSTEVCSTELVDQGNGAAKVVENCSYQVYDDYCKYTAQRWQEVDQAVAKGSNMTPAWPAVNLTAGEREGQRQESYKVFFDTKNGVKEYTTSDGNLFRQFQPGSTWTLEINPLGVIVSVRP